MSSSPSRRDLLKGGVAAALTVVPLSMAEASSEPLIDENAWVEAQFASVQAQLAHPLTEEAAKLMKQSLKETLEASQGRFRYKLPENSEPCFDFSVTRQGIQRQGIQK